jgi:phage/plasmid-associated DNA primase
MWQRNNLRALLANVAKMDAAPQIESDTSAKYQEFIKLARLFSENINGKFACATKHGAIFNINDSKALPARLAKYCEEKPKLRFFPYVEIRAEYSNFVLYCDYTDTIDKDGIIDIDHKNIGHDMQDLAAEVCEHINKMTTAENSTHVNVFYNIVDDVAKIRMHFIGVLMSTHAQLTIIEALINNADKLPPISDTHICTHFELGTTTMVPKFSSWNYLTSIECNINRRGKVIPREYTSKNIFVGINEAISMVTTDNDKLLPPNTNIKNLTDMSGAATDEPSDDLGIAISADFNARFFSIMLKYMPDDFYTDHEKWLELMGAFKHEQLRKGGIELLLRDFSTRHFNIAAAEFDNEWHNSYNKNFNLEFYIFRIKESKNSANYKADLKEFLIAYLRHECFANNGKITDRSLSRFLHYYFYGKYLSFDDKGNKRCIYEYVEQFDQCNYYESFKWRKCSSKLVALYNFLDQDINYYYEVVLESIKDTLNKKKPSSKVKQSKKNPMKKNFEDAKINLGNNTILDRAIVAFQQRVYNNLVAERLDCDPHIVGVNNGVLDLNLSAECPVPKLYTQYSPYMVTKRVRANYVPYDPDNEFVRLWENIYADIIIESDAREKIQYINSTAIENSPNKPPCLQEIGCGANGKSVINDNLLAVIGEDYGTKVSQTLLTSDVKGGCADPELMQLKGKRFALLAETNKGDKLKSARIKTITELKKNGRGLFENMSSFSDQATFKINTNFPLMIEDSDDGTWRRILSYRYNIRFLTNPNPDAKDEKQANVSYSTLAQDNTKAADALFSCLVHWRIEFQRLYKSNANNVVSETIDKATKLYRSAQDMLSVFLSRHLIIMPGYNEDGQLINGETEDSINEQHYDGRNISHKLELADLAAGYNAWLLKERDEKKKKPTDVIIEEFSNCRAIKKLIRGGADEAKYLIGARLVIRASEKVKEEKFIKIA